MELILFIFGFVVWLIIDTVIGIIKCDTLPNGKPMKKWVKCLMIGYIVVMLVVIIIFSY